MYPFIFECEIYIILFSGDRLKDRKRKSNKDNADDLLENLFSSILIKDSAANSSATRSGKHASVLVLDDSILGEGNSDCTTSTYCGASSEEFIEGVNDRLLHYEGTGVEVFEVHFGMDYVLLDRPEL